MDLTRPPDRNRYYLAVPPACGPVRATEARLLTEFGEDALAETRAWARGHLRAWGVREELAGDALLVLVELATNAIRAVRELPMPGIRPAVECQLICAGPPTGIMVTVWDTGLGEPAFSLDPVLDNTGLNDTGPVRGLGLLLARELSRGQVGWSASGRGKRVWANVGEIPADRPEK